MSHLLDDILANTLKIIYNNLKNKMKYTQLIIFYESMTENMKTLHNISVKDNIKTLLKYEDEFNKNSFYGIPKESIFL